MISMGYAAGGGAGRDGGGDCAKTVCAGPRANGFAARLWPPILGQERVRSGDIGMKNLAILGAGAVGGWLAGGLARAGLDVGLVARGATLVALRRDGLVVRQDGREERFAVRAGSAEELGPQDVVVLAVKAHDLPAAIGSLAPLLGPDTAVVSAMNGLPWWFFAGHEGPLAAPLEGVDPGGAIGRAVEAGRVVGAVAHMGARVVSPGVVQVAKVDRLLIGEPAGGGSARVGELVAAFRAGGVEARASDAIRQEIWVKLWGNSNMNPLSALTGATIEGMLDDPDVRSLVKAMMVEFLAVGERIGLPIAMAVEERIAVTRRLGPIKTSMLQDVEAGRTLETGPLLGVLVEIAERLDMVVPHLRGILVLVRLMDANRRRP